MRVRGCADCEEDDQEEGLEVEEGGLVGVGLVRWEVGEGDGDGEVPFCLRGGGREGVGGFGWWWCGQIGGVGGEVDGMMDGWGLCAGDRHCMCLGGRDLDNDCDNDGVSLGIYISPTPRHLGLFRTACAHVLEY